MGSDSKIFVAGHNGLVGSAIVRHLESQGFTNIITVSRFQCDLTDQKDVKMFFMMEQPEYVFLAAAKVGGIGGNADYPADFIYENLMIQSNVISCAAMVGVEKLLFLRFFLHLSEVSKATNHRRPITIRLSRTK
jgi:GDP-L-fucose synthase